jgi:hypothetical protein
MSHAVPKPRTDAPAHPRGQVLVIFAFLLTILIGMAAFVVDLAWIWSNQLQVQRAADAGALAGVVHLPGDPTGGIAAARDEAQKNGFEHNVNGVVVTANPDPAFSRRMIVNVSAPIDTFFFGLFGFDHVTVNRTAKAEYVLPVPMGSPENYYGVFGLARGLTSTQDVTVTNNQTTRGWSCGSGATWNAGSGCAGRVPTTAVSQSPAGSWTATSGTLANSLNANNDAYARTSTNNAQSVWGGFGAQSGMPNPGAGESLTIVGLQVRLTDAFLNSTCSGARFDVQLSWNNGTSWSSTVAVPASGNLGTNSSSGDYVVGSSTSMSAWGAHTWVRNDFSDANFRMRVTAVEGCSGSRTFSIDMADVRITWDYTVPVTTTTTVTTNLPDANLRGPGTTCTSGKSQCFEADGVALNPRGFWGTLNTQGAENINGDAHQPNYDTRTGGVSPACSSVADPDRACYDPNEYYNYAIEMPPGSTGGAVYVYDPGFCDVDEDRGTGDRWFGGDAAVSTFYTLYNTQGTLSEIGDDGAPIAASDFRFRNMDADDSSMGGSGGSECMYLANDVYGDGRDWHNRWYLLASGLTGGANGTVYRLHTTSTDPASAPAQLGTNGENSFAIFASATGGAPKVYGIGAMQAYTPLTANGGTVASEFYLAQIEAVHAGKTVEIHLWDPGDTQNLAAVLQILVPNAGGWAPTSFTWSSQIGTTNTGNTDSCDGATGSGTGVTTNTGGTSLFNGCWITIQAVIPANYTAPQDGWWKIRYNMTGNDTSFDVTTWKVNIIGNPVHLILPD